MPGSTLAEATEHQGRARVALNAALAGQPSHAYLFRGPRGSGKRAAARAFAAELLASASADPEDARRRALLDPSPPPHPVWLAPTGAQHMVEEGRERGVRAAPHRPLPGRTRGGGRCSTLRPTPTSSGSLRPGRSTWSRRCASG